VANCSMNVAITLLEELPIFYHATTWKDSNGTEIAGTNSAHSLTSLSHSAFISQHHIFGGFYAAELFLPIANVHLNTFFGPTYRTQGVGDLTAGPIMLQWNDAKLFGTAFFQRADLDFVLPTDPYFDRRPSEYDLMRDLWERTDFSVQIETYV